MTDDKEIDPIWAEDYDNLPNNISFPEAHLKCAACLTPMWGIIAGEDEPARRYCEGCETEEPEDETEDNK